MSTKSDVKYVTHPDETYCCQKKHNTLTTKDLCFHRLALILLLIAFGATIAVIGALYVCHWDVPQRLENQEKMISELSERFEFHKMHLHRMQKELQYISNRITYEDARQESMKRLHDAKKHLGNLGMYSDQLTAELSSKDKPKHRQERV